MLSVLTEPVRVKLIDDHDWFDPFLVPLAIILAGLIAAGLSWLIHRQSIGAEDRRLQRTFHHERRMRERDATRSMLDELGVLMTRIIDATTEFAGSIMHRSSLRAREQEASTDRERLQLMQQANEAQQAVNDSLMPAGLAVSEGLAARFRLRLRFPDDHPIVVGFDQWHVAIERWFGAMQQVGGMDILSEEQVQANEALAESASDKLRQFTEMARAWVWSTDEDTDLAD